MTLIVERNILYNGFFLFVHNVVTFSVQVKTIATIHGDMYFMVKYFLELAGEKEIKKNRDGVDDKSSP